MKLLRILVIACVGEVIFLSHSFACTCGPTPPTPEEEFNASVAVFTGQVIVVFPGDGSCSTATTALVQVTDCWKGVTTTLFTVYTPSFDGCCGFTFQQTQYIFYARSDPGLGGPTIYLCGRTSYLTNAAEDLAYLGKSNCTVPVHDTTWGAIKALYGPEVESSL